ncbi:hypothetical protein FRC05_004363 [Tulasnella sp. 425]|nr:hypothetical protein FRC05_004363 [Tulasnella sp. 425]
MTFADLQALSRDATPLYPPLDPMPILTHITEREREICRLDGILLELDAGTNQTEWGILFSFLSSSPSIRATLEIERYSDRFRPTARTRPVLRPTDLNKDFFPQSIWDAYFNPKKRPAGAAPPRGKKKKTKVDWSSLGVETEGGAGAVDLDGADERASQEGGDEEGGDNVEEMEDYEEEADDNDYEMNYFDNGEDENDDLGDGGGDPDGGGGGDDYD